MLSSCQQHPTKRRENAGQLEPDQAAQRVDDSEVRNSAVQPEADELLAALAPEIDADEDSTAVSESVSESEGASDDGGAW